MIRTEANDMGFAALSLDLKQRVGVIWAVGNVLLQGGKVVFKHQALEMHLFHQVSLINLLLKTFILNLMRDTQTKDLGLLRLVWDITTIIMDTTR